ncbi:MAG: hypothetical protein COW00_18585 [Bdellovibrio sp. CG12_big_fil_rev_8_21_14_0_65_39_13]|nr:MAG: hypothetical protein COW78_08360 [Bdellovibrio sp. CG22_combo_CG10-13_8_21_14_all_39_27]PIQ57889.1 MAG: hypothetical protein COW00_18585 [Bdellovibrio sp. CG12_big_fil_rev_8_21_14_0_65_39_13]PIR34558.1 MAG: hypothetical protein COV37_12660 [Bdellovibrio sp. CG11_big_fil_rev_8_21_14_0_20_39_38]PJB52384.1 MAG: hypothetical protein CO099_12865 [Bdellovibrio sp. CG_4_9_14_3_um_filter_39_7]
MKLKCTLLFGLLFSLLSCGASNEQKIKNSIEVANNLLSTRKCDEAIRELESVGQQTSNPRWLITYSSAYACKGGFSEPSFFANDLAKISSANDGLIGSLTLFSTSSTDGPFSTEYANLQRALEILLYPAGLTTSSHTSRLTKFTTSELSNMEVVAFYIALTQMGRYFYYYGDAGPTGTKGGGGAPNTCLATYTDGAAITAIDVLATDSCNSGTNLGHTDIETGVAATRQTRMCHGIVLFNNFIDLISNLTFSGANTGSLSALGAVFTTLCETAMGGAVPICSVKDQTSCEAATNADVEGYFAKVLETFFI